MCRGVQDIGVWDTIRVEMVSYRVEVYMSRVTIQDSWSRVDTDGN